MNFYKNKLNDFLILLREKELFVPLRALNRNHEQTAVLYMAWVPFFLISLSGSDWVSYSILLFQFSLFGLHSFDFFDLKNKRNLIEYNIRKNLENEETQKNLCNSLHLFIEEIKTIEKTKKNTFRHIFFLDLGARLDKNFNYFMKALFQKNISEATNHLLRIFNIMNNKKFQEQFFNSNLYNVIKDSFSKNTQEETTNTSQKNDTINFINSEIIEKELEIGFMKSEKPKGTRVEQIHVDPVTNKITGKNIVSHSMSKQESISTLEESRAKKLEEKL